MLIYIKVNINLFKVIKIYLYKYTKSFLRSKGSMKRLKIAFIHAVCAFLIFSTVFMTGCGKNTDDNDGNTYVFATWAAGEELKEFQEKIDRINNEANGDFYIKTLSIPSDYYIKISTYVAGKKTPDFFWLTQELISKYASMGVIADITDEFKASTEINPDTFYPGVLASAEYDCKYYGVPWIANPLIVYYNRDLFREAGVDFPDPLGGWTWDEFIDVASKLTVKKTDSNGNQYQQYGYIVDGWPNIETFIWAGGGDIVGENGKDILIDSHETLKGLGILQKILKSGITPKYSEVASLGSNNVWFEKQRAAMFMGGIQDNFEEKISKLPEEERFEIGYAPMPVCADGKPHGFDWTASTVMSKKLEGDKKAFMILEKITKEFFKWKIAPPIKGTVEQIVEIDPLKEPALPTIKICLENARSANYTPEWNEINDKLWNRIYSKMLNDPDFDYETEAKAVAREAREIMDKRK